MPRSIHGGRHELGQNFLTHTPPSPSSSILSAAPTVRSWRSAPATAHWTKPLMQLGRRLTAIELDEHRARRLARELPDVAVEHRPMPSITRFTAPVIVGNIPFHLTTPLLRRLLNTRTWSDAILLTQWEVARKRAAVGGSTLMTAQSAPWFSFHLHARVPSWGFTPPSER
nr:rRNA adenine N-6-methyltransferase family protein [Acidipropionibacterium acidipropionici]